MRWIRFGTHAGVANDDVYDAYLLLMIAIPTPGELDVVATAANHPLAIAEIPMLDELDVVATAANHPLALGNNDDEAMPDDISIVSTATGDNSTVESFSDSSSIAGHTTTCGDYGEEYGEDDDDDDDDDGDVNADADHDADADNDGVGLSWGEESYRYNAATGAWHPASNVL